MHPHGSNEHDIDVMPSPVTPRPEKAVWVLCLFMWSAYEISIPDAIW